jgi:1,4-dihydroxy-2-naphthoate octaprenyltransferase
MTSRRQQQQQQTSTNSSAAAAAAAAVGDGRPPSWKVWFIAARPHTLTASIAPNIVSYFAGLAYILPQLKEGNDNNNIHHHHSHSNGTTLSSSSSAYNYTVLTLQWTLFCMLIQLGTNLHNDYADFVRGADNDKRVGQARATQKGWLTPTQTATAAGQTLLSAFLLGLSFLYRMVQATKNNAQYQHILVMTFIVLSSTFNAFAYTGGPWPLGYIGLPSTFSIGYAGLGDVFVFLYFGLVATLVPPFLFLVCTDENNNDHHPPLNLLLMLRTILPPAIQVAALATNIIIVNNLRDRHTDVVASKKTVAVRFGPTFCRIEYGIMLLLSYGLVLHGYYVSVSSSGGIYASCMKLLPFLSFPLAVKEWQALYTKDGTALNQHVGGAAMVQFLFCILLGVSIYLS